MSTIKINKEEGKRVHVWIKSAIGTPNRRQFKHKNIMYPYFRMYKSPYRARDSRTRQAFWPCVDKYPWHTHQKRWVKSENLNIKFFSEFVNKPPSRRNLFETCHTLPFNGVNCLFWNPVYLNSQKFFLKKSKIGGEAKNEGDEQTEGDAQIEDAQIEEGDSTENKVYTLEKSANGGEAIGADERVDEPSPPSKMNKDMKVIRINDFYYIVEKKVKNDLYFYLKYIKYTMRPFRGKILGDLYLNEKKIRSNISPKGIVNGEWKCSFPHVNIKQKLASVTLNEYIPDTQQDDSNITNLVIADKYAYRPPLPKCFSEG
ncbi:conserved Plasmodium protein, unknown function [Plasmodium ovale wallikeri]|uniref:Uncharacterized protein n=2 Tax=Plasmodium ovale TaxID=36330 RepID=A0A1C3KVZ4_PLAOA|nr:conserved Plasmodium protein, unknown function [Plasmodium ovale wallikeri]SBT78332.1 conserved Plasmodium protein, unknown function [Plasmodium ovale]